MKLHYNGMTVEGTPYDDLPEIEKLRRILRIIRSCPGFVERYGTDLRDTIDVLLRENMSD